MGNGKLRVDKKESTEKRFRIVEKLYLILRFRTGAIKRLKQFFTYVL